MDAHTFLTTETVPHQTRYPPVGEGEENPVNELLVCQVGGEGRREGRSLLFVVLCFYIYNREPLKLYFGNLIPNAPF